jgi:arylsulfatase/uncharacterized sulfatase
MADAMDFHVGRLVAQLKATGQYENTVFVFLSDNGPEGSDYADAQAWLWTQYTQDIDKLGDKGAYSIMGPSWASAAGAPLGGYKFYAGEGGIRTPLIISGVPGMAKNQLHAGLTHVTDIAPTLLALAQLSQPGAQYAAQAMERMSGHNLLPVLLDPAQRARAADEALGYELAGSQALFKGDLKLVKNIPPVGDGQWHLYDLKSDPGETRDLQQQRPQDFIALQADYANWSRTHGVLPMPEGYDPVRQVLINSVLTYWIPQYRYPALALLLFGVAAWRLLRRRKRLR